MMLTRLVVNGLKTGLSNQKLLLSHIKSYPSRISIPCKFLSTEVDEHTYLYLTNETLESINDRFTELIEDHEKLSGIVFYLVS